MLIHKMHTLENSSHQRTTFKLFDKNATGNDYNRSKYSIIRNQ